MSQCSLSVTSNDVLAGDSSRRITVPLPKNLDELRYHSHQHFKGNRGMFHHGMKHVAHDDHVSSMKHGDVIVVRGAGDEAPGTPHMTQHAADYVKHPIEARQAPPPRPARETAKFEGASSHSIDFIRHPMETTQPLRPQHSFKQSKGGPPLGKSTYSQHFPWHAPKQGTEAAQKPALKPSAPFEGTTSYSNDFIKHPIKPRTPPGKVSRAPTGPFEGATTYSGDFHKHEHQKTQPSLAAATTLRPHSGPFYGTTEYKQVYLKHPIERPHMVHLEPEHAASAAARTKKNRSASAAP